jgi:hypothetical protein
MARPRLPIRPDQVDSLARRGWSVVEMAEFFRCDRGTLYKRFAAELGRVRAERAEGRRERDRREAEEAERERERERNLLWLLRAMRGVP